ncbi:MAG TPA: ectoine/hydroxyectoine ABC transporter substrate-binding protein EhuB, partial [Ochrobactrum anthropi]|nr:ectoine/hydroxyectoine ABC transporter substrate-binding protein EhuB [Brucella anthropi]
VVDGKSARSFGAFSFRPEDKEFYDAFNKELIEFKKTDDYKKILMTYGLSEESVEAARTVDTASLCNAK